MWCSVRNIPSRHDAWCLPCTDDNLDSLGVQTCFRIWRRWGLSLARSSPMLPWEMKYRLRYVCPISHTYSRRYILVCQFKVGVPLEDDTWYTCIVPSKNDIYFKKIWSSSRAGFNWMVKPHVVVYCTTLSNLSVLRAIYGTFISNDCYSWGNIRQRGVHDHFSIYIFKGLVLAR